MKKQGIIAVVLLVAAQFAAPLAAPEARAAAVPASLPAFYAAYKKGDNYGPGKLPDTAPNRNSLVSYYEANVNGKNPPTLTGTDYDAGRSNQSDENMVSAVYNSTYAEVKNLDERWWGRILNNLIEVADFKKDTYPNESDTAKFNADVKRLSEVELPGAYANIVAIYAGLNTLGAVKGNPELLKLVRERYFTFPQNGAEEATKERDIGRRLSDMDHGETGWQFAGIGTSNRQTSLLARPKKLQLRIEQDSTQNLKHDGDSDLYLNLADFYADFSKVAAAASAIPAAANHADVLKSQQTIKVLGAQIDAARPNGTVSEALANGTAGKCGTSAGILEIGKALKQALCNMVDFAYGLVQGFLSANIFFLGEMLPIGTPGERKALLDADQNLLNSGTGFLVNLVPIELKPAGVMSLIDSGLTVTMGNALRRLIGIIVVLALIGIALANVLQIDIQTYQIKKAVPALLVGFILAQFGILASKAVVEFANNATALYASNGLQGMVDRPDGTGQQGVGYNVGTLSRMLSSITATGPGGGQAASAAAGSTEQSYVLAGTNDPDMGKIFGQGILNFFSLAAGAMVFILASQLLLRSIVLVILVPLAPLAFFSSQYEPMKKLVWERWWKLFRQWAFMNFIAGFWIWLAFQFAASAKSINPTTTTDWVGGIIGYVFAMVCVYAAMTTPYKLAGEAKAYIDKAKGFTKKYSGYDRQKARLGTRIETVKQKSFIGDRERKQGKIDADMKERLDAAKADGTDLDVKKQQGELAGKISDKQQQLLNERDPGKRAKLQGELQTMLDEKLSLENGYFGKRNKKILATGIQKATKKRAGQAQLEILDASYTSELLADDKDDSYRKAAAKAQDLEDVSKLVKAEATQIATQQYVEGGFMTEPQRSFVDLARKARTTKLNGQEQVRLRELAGRVLDPGDLQAFETFITINSGQEKDGKAAFAIKGVETLDGERSAMYQKQQQRLNTRTQTVAMGRLNDDLQSEAIANRSVEEVTDYAARNMVSKLLEKDNGTIIGNAGDDATKLANNVTSLYRQDGSARAFLDGLGVMVQDPANPNDPTKKLVTAAAFTDQGNLNSLRAFVAKDEIDRSRELAVQKAVAEKLVGDVTKSVKDGQQEKSITGEGIQEVSEWNEEKNKKVLAALLNKELHLTGYSTEDTKGIMENLGSTFVAFRTFGKGTNSTQFENSVPALLKFLNEGQAAAPPGYDAAKISEAISALEEFINAPPAQKNTAITSLQKLKLWQDLQLPVLASKAGQVLAGG